MIERWIFFINLVVINIDNLSNWKKKAENKKEKYLLHDFYDFCYYI